MAVDGTAADGTAGRDGTHGTAADALVAELIGTLQTGPKPPSFSRPSSASPRKREFTTPDSGGGNVGTIHDEVDSMWTASSWVKSIEAVSACVASALTHKLGASYDHERSLLFLRSLGSHAACVEDPVLGAAAVAVLLRDGALLDGLATVLWQNLHELAIGRTVTEIHSQHSKFVQDRAARSLTFGDLDTFYSGLEAIVGPPNANVEFAIKEEHEHGADATVQFKTSNYGIETTSQIEYAFVVLGEQGLKDLQIESYPCEEHEEDRKRGRRTKALSEFEFVLAKHNELLKKVRSELLMEEFIAARL